MSEKMTTIRLPGLPSGEGFMDYGDCSAEHMIDTMRQKAARYRAVAAAIDAAADEDFAIEVVRGIYVQHPIRVIQKGKEL